MTLLQRRNVLIGLASSLAAPAIVHAGILMPIKPILVRGIRWQSWPLWEAKPSPNYGYGSWFALPEPHPISAYDKLGTIGWHWTPIY